MPSGVNRKILAEETIKNSKNPLKGYDSRVVNKNVSSDSESIKEFPVKSGKNK